MPDEATRQAAAGPSWLAGERPRAAWGQIAEVRVYNALAAAAVECVVISRLLALAGGLAGEKPRAAWGQIAEVRV
jgi:hypothetical protein